MQNILHNFNMAKDKLFIFRVRWFEIFAEFGYTYLRNNIITIFGASLIYITGERHDFATFLKIPHENVCL